MKHIEDTYNNMSGKDKQKFVSQYLKELAKSISVSYEPSGFREGIHSMLERFADSVGFGASKGTLSWEDRERLWYRPGNALLFLVARSARMYNPDLDYTKPEFDNLDRIPVFVSLAEKVLKTINPTKEETSKEMKNVKSTANQVLDTNKDAVKLAAQLGVGKTANSFFLNKLAGTLPWYSKLFGKKEQITQNPLAKLVTAELAVTLATHFADGNPKIKYIAEGMLQEAMIDMTVNSAMLTKFINELETMVTLPDFTKEIK